MMIERTPQFERLMDDKFKAAKEAVKLLTTTKIHSGLNPNQIEAVLLVGSIPKGVANEESDPDLLVITRGKTNTSQDKMRPLLQHIANSVKGVKHIDSFIVDEAIFKKTLNEPITEGMVLARRLADLSNQMAKLPIIDPILQKAYPKIQPLFKKMRGHAYEVENAKMHTAEEQLMSEVLYEKNPGDINKMLKQAGLEPHGIFQYRGFEKVIGNYLDGKTNKKETRKILQDHAPFLWKYHAKKSVSTYKSSEHQKKIRELL